MAVGGVSGRSEQQMNLRSSDIGVRNGILLQETVVEGIYLPVRVYVKQTTGLQPSIGRYENRNTKFIAHLKSCDVLS
jgi:hypothetical protein